MPISPYTIPRAPKTSRLFFSAPRDSDIALLIQGPRNQHNLGGTHPAHRHRLRRERPSLRHKRQAGYVAFFFEKDVVLQTHGYDKYKRILGDVILPDGLNLNQELVTQGWCWWYRKYAPGDAVLEGLEVETRETKEDLWSAPVHVSPREWPTRNR